MKRVQFFLVINIAKSLAAEFQVRGIQVEGADAPGKSIGMAMCILMCCSLIPFLGILTSIAGLVCWIIYWVKIAGFSKQLA
jgi:uncharacterized protein (DUF2062 family)